MNQSTREIILEFTSDENTFSLQQQLCQLFNDRAVTRFLEANMNMLVRAHADRMEQEMGISEPLPGVTIMTQLLGYNDQFLRETQRLITENVLKEERIPMFMVTDNLPTSRKGIGHHAQSADDILRSWYNNSGRPIQAREDPQGYDYNSYYGAGMTTGIVFCDQRRLGTQNHVDQYNNTTYKRALNNGARPHEDTAFGVSTPAADARLLSRRTFRSNERGVENGIPSYEQRLYRRHLERDISEGLRGPERDCLLLGHDMRSLHARVDYKNRIHARNQPSCDERSLLFLQHNNAPMPWSMQYS